MMTSRGATGLLIAVGVGMVGVCGCHRPPDPAQEAAARIEAQARWLELHKSGKDVLKGMANARLLISCFKEGELASSVEKILATGRQEVYGKMIEYTWMFEVEKPREPDETGFLLTVVVAGKPPKIQQVYGGYSVD